MSTSRIAVIGDRMNSSMSREAPASFAGDTTTSARAAQPPLAGCPGAPLRDHFPIVSAGRLPEPVTPTLGRGRVARGLPAGTPTLAEVVSHINRPTHGVIPAARTGAAGNDATERAS